MDTRSGTTVGNEYDARKLADATARSNVQHEKILPPLPLAPRNQLPEEATGIPIAPGRAVHPATNAKTVAQKCLAV